MAYWLGGYVREKGEGKVRHGEVGITGDLPCDGESTPDEEVEWLGILLKLLSG